MANSPTSTAGAGSWRCRFRAQARNDEKRGRSFAGSSSCGQRRGRKPLSVFESAIYLRNLPPGIGRAALICRYIWSCRPAAVPAVRRRTASWALTPRFHPYPCGRFFSVTDGKDYSLLCFPQPGALPCADFPHRRPFDKLRDRRRGRSSRLFGCKGTKKVVFLLA